MAIFDKPIFDWKEEDIKYLVDNKLPENLRLEYKQELNIKTPKERKEFTKDVSAFANSEGGHLVYGIKENKQADGSSIPDGLLPITNGELPKISEDILLHSISPKMKFSIYPIPAKKGGYYLVFYIPQSFDCHMVTIDKDNRFYIRRNFQSERMTENEVSRRYEQKHQRIEKIDERFETKGFQSFLHNVSEEKWCYIIAIPYYSTPLMIDTRRYSADEFNLLDTTIRHWGSLNLTNGPVGFENIRDTNGNVYLIVKLHRDGSLEMGKNFSSSRGDNLIPTTDIYNDALSALIYYGRVYAKIGYYGPIRIFYCLKNLTGTSLGVSSKVKEKHFEPDFGPYPNEQFVYTMDIDVESLLTNVHEPINEIMDFLWQSYGWNRFYES